MEIQLLKIKRGRLDDHWEELLADMFKEHWEEIARNKELMVLNPDYPLYKQMEDQGKLVVLYVYDDDKLVGYSHTILNHHLHYKGLFGGYNDLLYIHPDYRNGMLGIKLIKETENEVRKEGAKIMSWHAKENTALAKILPRMGNKVQEIIYSKEL